MGFKKIFIIGILLFIIGCSAAIGPKDVVFKNPEQAIIDARQIITEKLRDPEKYSDWILPDKLPESLRITPLKYAMVYEDHISFVMAKNPDWNVGARIWSINLTRKHNDKPTKYNDIFFYQYTNDLPESPDNIK